MSVRVVPPCFRLDIDKALADPRFDGDPDAVFAHLVDLFGQEAAERVWNEALAEGQSSAT